MRKTLGSIILSFAIVSFAYAFDSNPSDWKLVWSDEFDGYGLVNGVNWFHQTQLPNGISWYNSELQHYTNSATNSFRKNGILNIVAKRETFTDQGQTKQFTSARLNSKFAFKYGRVEVRAKLPTGAGTWPAIWMLGKNIIEPGAYWTNNYGTINWPACGEIDIMENELVNIDSVFQERMALHEEPMSKGAWNRMQHRLDEAMPQKKRPLFFIKRFFAIMILLSLSLVGARKLMDPNTSVAKKSRVPFGMSLMANTPIPCKGDGLIIT